MKEELEKLAFELDRFAMDFDPYDYGDYINGYDEWKDCIEQTCLMLDSGEIKPITDWFEEYVFVDGDEDKEAKELLKRVEAFG